ncbi:MAG TPA: tRNA (adenosine(37)-N6)-threonylcarbamoyltransferase complex transferase subunit TsaD [Chloroflexota bacterium]|nr:tRNA (adenosine(37)-N6)-threonylcarbamoyltransferase complex transferase subunit TsaD [Chloroflexota bacterium]
MNILGIDTSCDDTAAAVVTDGRHIRANLVRSQLRQHAPHGGVVPEVASRAHLGDITAVVREALDSAGLELPDIDAIGVTYGPGLGGSLMVGLNFAKGLALARDLPLLPINHLEGHIYSNWLIADPEHPVPEPRFPLIVLIVSGGHTELLLMSEHCRYQRLGGTRDDAAGEAFDKVGRQLGLGYPGGPAIQRAAEGFSGPAPELPRAWLRGNYDFSFSGLKTAVWHYLENQDREQGNLSQATRAGVAVAFQESVVDVLATKVKLAAAQYGAATVAICGGVASNAALRRRVCKELDVPVYVPPPALCVDNGAMIAAAAYYRWLHPELAGDVEDPMLVEAKPGLAVPRTS